MSDVVQVTAAVILDGRTVLITQRHSSDRMGDKWEFPGGKIEPGESPQACLQRELWEELGVVADIHELYCVSRYAYPHIQIELLAYRTVIRSGQPQLRVHQAYSWIGFDKLSEVDFCEADRPIVEKLLTTQWQ